jgi:glucokinase
MYFTTTDDFFVESITIEREKKISCSDYKSIKKEIDKYLSKEYNMKVEDKNLKIIGWSEVL